MNVREFIAWLSTMPQEDEVVAWDPDAEGYYPVSGAVYGHGRVELQTDDPED
jgi:hypothetical protein